MSLYHGNVHALSVMYYSSQVLDIGCCRAAVEAVVQRPVINIKQYDPPQLDDECTSSALKRVDRSFKMMQGAAT